MTATPILGITEVAPNQAAKEVTINDGFARIEQSLNDTVDVNLTSGNATLTTSDFQSNFVFRCYGHSVARTMTVTDQVRYFAVKNDGSDTVQVKTSTVTTSYTVAAGDFALLYCDGNHNVSLLGSALAVGGVTIGLDQLTDVILTAAADGDRIEFNGTNWVNKKTADLKSQSVSTTGTSLSINRNNGEAVTLSLGHNISAAFTVSNWGASGKLSRLILFVNNTGSFNITAWPSGTIWAGGVAPTITSGSGKHDIIILTTLDGGTTIYGSVGGQDYS